MTDLLNDTLNENLSKFNSTTSSELDDLDSLLNEDLSTLTGGSPELSPAEYSELVANLPPLDGFINTSLNIDSIPSTTVDSFKRNLSALEESQDNKFFFVQQMMRSIQSAPSLMTILRPADIQKMVDCLQSEYKLVSYIKATKKSAREKASAVKASLKASINQIDVSF